MTVQNTILGIDEGMLVFHTGNEIEPEVLPYAGCEPSDTPVRIEKSDRFSAGVLPPCVKVKRCGGCCNADGILECVPISTKTRFVKVRSS